MLDRFLVRPTVVLFDIDGTLIRTRAGRIAMVRAVEDYAGPSEGFSGVRFAGMTDRAIIREGLRLAGHGEISERHIDEVAAAYVRHLRDEVSKDEGYQVLPGIEAALAWFGEQKQTVVGLGTGNVEEGARVKLGPSGISERFEFGGFGSDHEDRAELLRAGVQRGAGRLGVAPQQCLVMVIGDTPRDVQAAADIQAVCLAVSTGSYSTKELRAAGARLVFKDLQDMVQLLADD